MLTAQISTLPDAALHEVSLSRLQSLSATQMSRLVYWAAQRDPLLREQIAALLKTRNGPEAMEQGEFLIGSSPAMLEVFDLVRRFGATSAPVLITGESGTGKELVARALHERSPRAGEPFVAINCAALPPSLVAAELFGHEKGAFTGAMARSAGHLEMAHRGTLFLDEIGDLPIEMQGHLLRFLQEGTVTRLGGRQPLRVDARVIAATNVPLRPAMQERRFREDLYYRLAVLTIALPPLRARGGDLELLATCLLQRIGAELGHAALRLDEDAMAALRAHAWPGNVRELIAVLRRAAVMSDGMVVTRRDLGLQHAAPPAPVPRRERPPARSGAERNALLETLARHNWSVSAAAREVGVSRMTLYRMLERNDIKLRETDR